MRTQTRAGGFTSGVRSRLFRSATFLGIGLLTALSSEGATVTGTLKYRDTVSAGCTDPAGTGCVPLQPIVSTQVEIWHHGTMFWDVWAPVGQVTTDGNGYFSFSDTRGQGTYAVRVFAMNYAARVGPGGADWFYAEPGNPGANVNLTVTSASQVVDFSFDFVDGSPALVFNIAETVRRGHDYARARRDPRETDPLPRASFVLTDSPGSPANVSWYNPVWNEVVLHSRDAQRDTTILHEYGHWLEAQLSSFAWIASNHDGCRATDLSGTVINSPEHAWMEGFADYFSQAVPRFLPPGTLSGTAGVLESPGPCTVSAAAAIENRVAGSLWDLADPYAYAPTELHDFVSSADRAIFEIFDRELDTFGHWPTIWDFRNAWAARGYDLPALDRILTHHEILQLPLQTAQFVAQSVPAQMIVGTSYSVSVTMRNTGATIWEPGALHRLGSQRPQDNWIWGTNRVGLPASVRPGGYATFSFTVTAPSTPGGYNFQWQMVQDGVEWFGDLTPPTAIGVITTDPPPDPDPDPEEELCFDPVRRKLVAC